MARPKWAKPPGPPPYASAPVIDYGSGRRPQGSPPRRRGVLPLVLSIAAMLPALAALIVGMSGPYRDPFTIVALFFPWALALVLNVAATGALVTACRTRRPIGPDLLRHAIAASIFAWALLGLSTLMAMDR